MLTVGVANDACFGSITRTKGRSSDRSVIGAVNLSVDRCPSASTTVAERLPALVMVKLPLTSLAPLVSGDIGTASLGLAITSMLPPERGRLLLIQICTVVPGRPAIPPCGTGPSYAVRCVYAGGVMRKRTSAILGTVMTSRLYFVVRTPRARTKYLPGVVMLVIVAIHAPPASGNIGRASSGAFGDCRTTSKSSTS